MMLNWAGDPHHHGRPMAIALSQEIAGICPIHFSPKDEEYWNSVGTRGLKYVREAVKVCVKGETAKTNEVQTARAKFQCLSPLEFFKDFLDPLQWPAMAVTIFASWLVASTHERRRNSGFWVFLIGNAAWAVWAWPTQAWALIALQVALAAMNIRGPMKTEKAASGP